MASLLVPLPFAADDHQRRNAETFVKAGAATMVLDAELTANGSMKRWSDATGTVGLKECDSAARKFR